MSGELKRVGRITGIVYDDYIYVSEYVGYDTRGYTKVDKIDVVGVIGFGWGSVIEKFCKDLNK